MIRLLFITTLFLSVSVFSHCIYSEEYWRLSSLSEWPSNIQEKKLCGKDWHFLMNVRSDEVWFTVFRQIATATLNNYSSHYGTDILSFLDNLSKGCINKPLWENEWNNDRKFRDALDNIRHFNLGEKGHPLCQKNVTLQVSYNNDQLILQQQEWSKLESLVKLILLMIGLSVFLLIIIMKKIFQHHHNQVNHII